MSWSCLEYLQVFIISLSIVFIMNSNRLGAKSMRQIPPIRMKQVLLLLGCIHWSVFVVPALVNDWVVRWLCLPPKHRPNSFGIEKNLKTKGNF